MDVNKKKKRKTINTKKDRRKTLNIIEQQLNKDYYHNEWYVEGINVSEKFREYQLDALKMAKEKNLTWNSIYEILVQLQPVESGFSKKISDIFNEVSRGVPTILGTKISEDLHSIKYLHPFINSIFFTSEPKLYEVRLNQANAGSKTRPDFSCIINNIPLLNTEIKPIGVTPLRKKKDFIKGQLRAKKSVNQLLDAKGGPARALSVINMGERLDSYVIDLRYDGLYRSWEFAKTKLVVEKSSMPSIESSIIHFLALEEQVKILAQDFIKRPEDFTPPAQISNGYIRNDPESPQLKRLLNKYKSPSSVNGSDKERRRRSTSDIERRRRRQQKILGEADNSPFSRSSRRYTGNFEAYSGSGGDLHGSISRQLNTLSGNEELLLSQRNNNNEFYRNMLENRQHQGRNSNTTSFSSPIGEYEYSPRFPFELLRLQGGLTRFYYLNYEKPDDILVINRIHSVPLFWYFITAELILQSTRLLLQKDQLFQGSTLGSLAANLPAPFPDIIKILIRYRLIWNSLWEDVCVLVFVVGFFITLSPILTYFD
ncbi:22518_t:CDS:10 [Entrophospora sp. SA101]|nr:22518_t:CDS:10 [Entrophospora sp. SA101]